MNRIATLCLFAVLVWSSTGCKQQPQEPAVVAPATPEPTVQPTPPVPPPPTEPTPSLDLAEVELTGTLEGAVEAARFVVVVTKKGCQVGDLLPLVAEAGFVSLDRLGSFGMEIFVPQGSEGHLCAVAVDKAGAVVATATYSKNPLKMEGKGEVMMDGLKLALEKLPAPVPLPKELQARH